MNAQSPSPATGALRDLLTGELRLGEPDTAGPLTVFPIFGAEARFEYASFADGRNHGATITELEGGASVRDLVVHNPTPLALLLYDGEEVLGAQQNRTIDVSVMAQAGQKTHIPVSCVEQGRWDGRRHTEDFQRAPQAAYPELRRSKARQVREAASMGMEARADQGVVWRDVAQKAARHNVASDTGAIHDVFESRRGRLSELTGAISLHDEQTGTLVAIDGQITVLDWVSRPSVFADLHAPLVQGYALDAIEHKGSGAPSAGEAEGFLSLALDNTPARSAGVGLGQDLRFEGNGAEGAGLEIQGEMVQLTAFASGADEATPAGRRAARVRRPSQRRRT